LKKGKILLITFSAAVGNGSTGSEIALSRNLNMALPDEYLHIDTPENVAFDYQVAGIGSRFLAALIDTILILLLQALVNVVLFLLLTSMFGNPLLWDTSSAVGWTVALFGLIAFAFLWGYYVFFEMKWNGQSPGKRKVGLRVIRTDGMPITLTESLIRNLVRLVDFLPTYYGLGVVTMFINEQARRLGDLAAGTVVIHDRAHITLENLDAEAALSRLSRSTPGPARSRPSEEPQPQAGASSKEKALGACRPQTPVGHSSPTTGRGILAFSRETNVSIDVRTFNDADWPVERLTNRDLQIAEDFVRRKEQLSNRSAVAQSVAQALFERMGLPTDRVDEMSAEDLILRIIQASRKDR
jgi:uncharacterized RDD family membrane protein YckC